jgi:hypothetical protein
VLGEKVQAFTVLVVDGAVRRMGHKKQYLSFVGGYCVKNG